MKIPITKPFFDEEEKKAVCAVLDSGWVVQGSKVAEFERLVSEYVGAKFAKASTSCTTSLHLALLALGIGKGDEVLVPSFTFIASANAIEYTGAKPVFVDIDLNTFNIDAQKVEECLERDKTHSVKAIIPVHLFGLCADMKRIMELAREYHLFVVEDAACALGSLYNGKHAGTFGDASCFSLHPRKIVTTGEGGMLTTNKLEIATNVERLRNHGATVSDKTRHDMGVSLLSDYDVLGWNYRMTDLQGAIGVVQMHKLSWIIEKRVEKAKRYDEELKGLSWLKTPYVPDSYRHTYQSYVTLVQSNELRNQVMATLAEKGIATRQGTHAVHTLNYYKNKYNLKDEDYPNSLAVDRLSMTLPLYPQMTDDEQDYVINQLKAIN